MVGRKHFVSRHSAVQRSGLRLKPHSTAPSAAAADRMLHAPCRCTVPCCVVALFHVASLHCSMLRRCAVALPQRCIAAASCRCSVPCCVAAGAAQPAPRTAHQRAQLRDRARRRPQVRREAVRQSRRSRPRTSSRGRGSPHPASAPWLGPPASGLWRASVCAARFSSTSEKQNHQRALLQCAYLPFPLRPIRPGRSRLLLGPFPLRPMRPGRSRLLLGPFPLRPMRPGRSRLLLSPFPLRPIRPGRSRLLLGPFPLRPQ